MTRQVVLVGLRASGKSSVGRLVAGALGWPFADTDELVEAAAGRSATDIITGDGMPAFRALESAALAEALEQSPLVLATGGGAVLSAANRTRMLAVPPPERLVVWLDAPPGLLAGRFAGNWRATRPALTELPLVEELAQLAGERAAFYAEVATLRLDAAQGVGEVAAAVLSGGCQPPEAVNPFAPATRD